MEKTYLVLVLLLSLSSSLLPQDRKFPAEYSSAGMIDGLPPAMPETLAKTDAKNISYAVIKISDPGKESYLLRENKRNGEPQFWILKYENLERVSVTGINYSGDGIKVYDVEFEPADENNLIYRMKFYFYEEEIHYKIYSVKNFLSYLKINGGVAFETAFLSAGDKVTYYDPKTGGEFSVENQYAILFAPLCISGILRLSVAGDNHLELRTGFSLAGKYYSSVELGLFLRRDFLKRYFVSLGAVVNGSFGESHGIMVSYNTGRTNYFYGVGLGYTLGKSTDLVLSAFYVPDSDYGHVSNHYNNTLTEPYLRWLLRFGVQINFGKPPKG